MKKIISISIVLVLVAGAAFAQNNADGISINAWGRAAFSPLSATTPSKTDGEVDKDANGDDVKGKTYAGVSASWGGDKPRVDFRINGNSEFVGFQVHVNAEGGEVANGDNGAHIWAKPFGSDILKLTAGTFIEETLRGKVGNLDGGFSNFVLNKTPEEDAIFYRFGSSPGASYSVYNEALCSFMLSSAPVDGLFIGLMVNGARDSWWNNGVEGGTPAPLAYRYMQIGAGYQIPDIGHFRAQYIGGWAGTIDATKTKPGEEAEFFNLVDDFDKSAKIELAFALTAVEGLLVDLGGKIWLPLEVKDVGKGSKGIDISLGAQYNSGDIGIGARFDISGLGAYTEPDGGKKDEDGMEMVIRLVPVYNLDAVSIGLDLALAVKGEGKYDGTGKEDNATQFGFGAFVQKGLGKGNIKAGLTYTLAPSYKDGATGSDIFQIPIIFEYAFF